MVTVTGGPSRVADVPLLPVSSISSAPTARSSSSPTITRTPGRAGTSWSRPSPARAWTASPASRTATRPWRVMKEVVAALFPWDEPFVRNMQLADPLGWLVGSVTPTVRRPAARLAVGAVVAALGDTAISYDPIAAQGANSGIKQARHLVESIVAPRRRRVRRRVDHVDVRRFFDEHARHACRVQQSAARADHRAGEGAADRAVRQRRRTRQSFVAAAHRRRVRRELQRPAAAHAGIHRHGGVAAGHRIACRRGTVAVERSARTSVDRARSGAAEAAFVRDGLKPVPGPPYFG